MSMKNEVAAALQAHAAWRKKFKDILNGRVAFDLASIDATDQCFFGHWLANEGHRMIPSALHDEICNVHGEFHHIAAGIIQKIKERRFAEAQEDISPDGSLNQASERLRQLLLKLSFREPVGAGSTLPQGEPAATAQAAGELLMPPADEMLLHNPD